MSHNEPPLPLLDQTLPPHPLGPFRPRGRGRTPTKPTGPTCRGGGTIISDGYVMEYARDHPRCNKAGRCYQHRLVMECLLGRLLEPDEDVHHDNRIRHDNRGENLELKTRADHLREHIPEMIAANTIPLTEDQVREALQGRTTLQAAKALGVGHMTLRRRFGHLLGKRRSPLAPLHPAKMAKLLLLAADPTVGQRLGAKRLGVCHRMLRIYLEQFGVQWVAAPVGRPKRKASTNDDPC